MARGDRQVNVRVPPPTFQILEAAAFVHETSVATMLLELAEDAAEGWRHDPLIQTALRARRERAERESADILPLDRGRRNRPDPEREE
jgi:hypothetical protein